MDHSPPKPGRIRPHRPRRESRPARAARVSDVAGVPRRLARRKAPRQERSRATVEAILEAAADLLASHGRAGTSTNRIAARAGVSVGSLYQYFPNKDAIVMALVERHAADIDDVVEAAFAQLRRPDVAVRDAMRRMLQGFAAVHDANPKLAQAVDPHAGGADLPADLFRRREERFRSALADVLRRRSDVRRGNHTLMASLLFDVVDAVTRSLMHGDARRFDRCQALDEAIEAICRYIEV